LTFRHVIGLYLKAAQGDGSIASPNTVRTYVSILNRLADDVSNRDPRTVGKDDINRCLDRWPNPSSRSTCRSIMVSFFDFCEQEDITPGNPARKTRPPKVKKAERYRLTLDETLAIVAAAHGSRERRVIYLATFAGLRNAELRGLKGRHLQRDGFIWVSRDIGKGNRERWIPVLEELTAVVAEIRADVSVDEYVLPALRWADAPVCTRQMALRKRASSSQALCHLVRTVMQRAGIGAAFDKDSGIGPHTLRHAFTDYVANATGDVRIVQALLGHANLATTQTYLSKPTLDQLTAALKDRRFPLPPTRDDDSPGHEPNGGERSITLVSSVEPFVERWLQQLEPAVRLYEEAFA
jgi:integrase/recombinase XerD